MNAFHKIPFLLLALLLTTAVAVNAQQEQKDDSKKIVIITKTIDENGNEVVKRIEKSGDEIDDEVITIDINGDTNQAENDDSKPMIIITKTIDENGNEVVKRIKKSGEGTEDEVITIDIDGNANQNFDINVDTNDGHKRIHIKGVDENGEAFDLEWEGDGEIPAELKEKMDKGGAAHFKGPHHRRMMFHEAADDHGFLGVVMGKKVENENGVETTTGESEAGVTIDRVVSGSAAEAAGLKAGDILSSINGQSVKTLQEVTDAISQHQAGDKIEVGYLRDGQTQTVEATLKNKERNHPQGNAFYWMDDEGEDFNFDHENFIFRPCKPFIGVYLNLGSDSENGIAVGRIIPNTPAEVIQLQEGDIITAIDNKAVSSHSELLQERDKHQPGDHFTLTFVRDGVSQTVDATFPSCDQEEIITPGKRQIIIIKKNKEATAEEETAFPNDIDIAEIPESNLQLDNFRAFPNPSEGQITLRFDAEAAPVVVTVTDISGKEIFRDAVNDFNGSYNRQVDLSKAADGTLLLSIRQGDQIFTDKIIMKNRP